MRKTKVREEPVTSIKLELIIGRQSNIKLEGSCYKETPGMNTKVSWYHCNGSVPKGSIDSKKLLRDATLFRKYSQLISYANENYHRKPYKIKMSVRRNRK